MPGKFFLVDTPKIMIPAPASTTNLAYVKPVNLLIAIIIFFFCVFPPAPITSNEIWCAGTAEEGCKKFMLFPIGFSIFMIASNVFWMILVYSNVYARRAYISCIDIFFEFAVCLLWPGAGIVIILSVGSAKQINTATGNMVRHSNR